MPYPDGKKFMCSEIISRKETMDRQLQHIMAFIYRNPNFVQAKAEETSRLINEETPSFPEELIKDQYIEKHEDWIEN